jgi:hypothetical protein
MATLDIKGSLPQWHAGPPAAHRQPARGLTFACVTFSSSPPRS